MGGHGRLFVFLFGRGDHLCIFYLGGDDPFLCFSLEDVVCFLYLGGDCQIVYFSIWKGMATYCDFYLEGAATYLFTIWEGMTTYSFYSLEGVIIYLFSLWEVIAKLFF